jgi:hypothetical protein
MSLSNVHKKLARYEAKLVRERMPRRRVVRPISLNGFADA